MSFDWAHQFCLACDKQTDGATYCSESCRLADYEKTSTTSSAPSSPAFTPPQEWSFPKPAASSSTRFYLSPAYDFSHTRTTLASRQTLSPSNSHTSLCSMKSTSSTSSETSQVLSEKATKELRAYTRSLESVRLQRRRSY